MRTTSQRGVQFEPPVAINEMASWSSESEDEAAIRSESSESEDEAAVRSESSESEDEAAVRPESSESKDEAAIRSESSAVIRMQPYQFEPVRHDYVLFLFFCGKTTRIPCQQPRSRTGKQSILFKSYCLQDLLSYRDASFSLLK